MSLNLQQTCYVLLRLCRQTWNLRDRRRGKRFGQICQLCRAENESGFKKSESEKKLWVGINSVVGTNLEGMGQPKHKRVLLRKQTQQGRHRNIMWNVCVLDTGTRDECYHVANREMLVIQLEKFWWQRQNLDCGLLKTYHQGNTHTAHIACSPTILGKHDETMDFQAQGVILYSMGKQQSKAE